MIKILKYLCCCGCCQSNCCKRSKINFEKRDSKRRPDLSQLESITSSKQTNIWSTATNPLNVKTSEMTEHFKIPNNEFKTEEDVINHLGYRIDNFIDSGTFASVHCGTHLSCGLIVAIKKILIPKELDKKSTRKRKHLLKDIKIELFVLEKVRHRHIIRLINHFVINCFDQMTLYIIMQFAKGGTLSDKLEKSGPFSEKSVKIWLAQMLSALRFVHDMGIAHRDLKLSNILLDEYNDVLVSDFGLSRVVWRKNSEDILEAKTFCGTPPYMPPEMFRQLKDQSSGYDAQAVDVWALGVILYRLITNDYPFPPNINRAMNVMKHKLWKFPHYLQISSQLKDFLNSIFEPNPDKRPKVNELKNHKWISKVLKEVEEKSFKWSESQKFGNQ